MASLKIGQFFLLVIFIYEVTCGSVHRNENENSGQIQNVHNIKRRSPFLRPLKHVIGHIADHLGVHRSKRPDWEDDRHFHHHHGSSFDLHNSYPRPQYPEDFSGHHDPNVHYGHPQKYPDIGDFPHENKHGYDFQPHSQPDFHHPQFHKNHDFHGYRQEKPDNKHETPVVKNDPPINDFDKTTNKAVIYPPFHVDDQGIDDPVSDFDRNKEGVKDKKPIGKEEGRVDLESVFSGTEDTVKNGGKDHRGWVVPEEDNKEGGVIPSTSQIDIRFGRE